MAFLIAIGFLSIIAGIIGCVLPVIPGPILSYCGLIIISLAYKWKLFHVRFLVIMGIITAIVTTLDYVLPLISARKFGASKYSVWGSLLGMIIGVIFFPPFGLLIGAFIGAVLGELIFNMNTRQSLKAGIGALIGTVSSIFIKLGTSGVIAYYAFRAVIKG
jgi:uncharacterized protein YqgC (DUF456 family)